MPLSPAALQKGCKKLTDLLKEWGGKGEATIFVYGYKVPAHHAALINGTMSRGFDFESLVGGGATHVAGSIVPAAFALAEYARVPQNERKFQEKTLLLLWQSEWI